LTIKNPSHNIAASVH